MQDARCAAALIVLLSTALVKPAENATGGDLDGIYRKGWVPIAWLRAWQRLGKTRQDSL